MISAEISAVEDTIKAWVNDVAPLFLYDVGNVQHAITNENIICISTIQRTRFM